MSKLRNVFMFVNMGGISISISRPVTTTCMHLPVEEGVVLTCGFY